MEAVCFPSALLYEFQWKHQSLQERSAVKLLVTDRLAPPQVLILVEMEEEEDSDTCENETLPPR